MNRNDNPLGSAPIGGLLLQYAVPSIISTLMASLYNMVDQIFIGQRRISCELQYQQRPWKQGRGS